jgi:hypothetical protein
VVAIGGVEARAVGADRQELLGAAVDRAGVVAGEHRAVLGARRIVAVQVEVVQEEEERRLRAGEPRDRLVGDQVGPVDQAARRGVVVRPLGHVVGLGEAAHEPEVRAEEVMVDDGPGAVALRGQDRREGRRDVVQRVP